MKNYEDERTAELFDFDLPMELMPRQLRDELKAARLYGIVQGLYTLKNHWMDEHSLEANFNIVLAEAFLQMNRLNPALRHLSIDDLLEDKWNQPES